MSANGLFAVPVLYVNGQRIENSFDLRENPKNPGRVTLRCRMTTKTWCC